jgi:ubiquinone/menaquinone biosynthesis C-methylase UbiE
VAESYARVHTPITTGPAEDLVALLEVRPGSKVLDLGTGTGLAARAAVRSAGPQSLVVGVDPSVPMLRIAARSGPGPRYAASNAIDLPFRNGTFQYVIATFVLPHFQKYETALYDVLRVMASGARMGVTTWAAADERDDFRRAWRAVAEQFAEREILSDAQRRALPWEERFSDPDRLKLILHEAGLRDIWVERRDYRVEVTMEDYLESREVAAIGRFLRYTLGPELWETFRGRARETFATQFPPTFNDFREVILAVGHKPPARG